MVVESRGFLRVLVLSAIAAGVVFGQTEVAHPAFLAADVHVSPHSTTPTMRGGLLAGGRYEIHNATMVDLVKLAYGTDADRIVGGPSWLEWNRYEIAAKAPAGTTAEAASQMLRTLLADRFKLTIHNDTRPIPGYALTAGKKPLLKEAKDGESGCNMVPLPSAPPSNPAALMFTYNCRNVTMEAFAAALRGMALVPQQYLNNLGVADQTGLKGAWDFDLKYSPRLGNVAASELTTIFDAVDKQLGLKLDAAKVPLPVIVVDNVSDKPTPNAANISALLPPPPPVEFEVATLKPTAPDFRGGRFQVQNGRVDIQGIPLTVFINQMWSIDERTEIVGLPDWVNTDRFDLAAKAPAGALSMSISPNTVTNSAPPDTDTLFAMLKSLIIERFQIQYHYEDRPTSAFDLVANKPKMKRADPSNRTACKEGPGADGKDPRIANPALSRLVTCLNITMAQFADQMQNMAGGYIHSPVVDKTGLDGAWDFTLSFSAAGILQAGNGGGGRGGDGERAAPAGQGDASDPSGGISLIDAINKDLGVKLDAVKRPVHVLVIDHISRTPADN